MHQIGSRPDPISDGAFEAGPIAILPQRFDARVTQALDAIPADHLPELHVVGPMRDIGPAIMRRLTQSSIEPAWLRDWLTQNVLFQTSLFGQLTRAKALDLRLEAVATDERSRFHIGRTRYRLLCSYRGAGIEWINPKAASDAPGRPLDPSRVRCIERGAIAFIRGEDGAVPCRPALVHRLPDIEGSAVARLLLTIDDDGN